MRMIATLLLCVGCATTRTETPPTTPAAPAPAEPRKTPEDPEARRLVAELEASLATPLPAVPEPLPEPTPPEPTWAGYMVVQTDSVPPAVAVLFADGPEGDVITRDVLARGISLRAALANSNDGYWLFPVTRGALLFKAVRVYDDGRVVVEISFDEYAGTTIIVAANILDDPSGARMYTPCAHGVCGRLRKAVANHIVGCEGPHCAQLVQPAP